MFRRRANEHKSFTAAVDFYAREVEAALSRRHKEMGQEWDDLDKGWQDLNNAMAKVGIAKPSESCTGSSLWLNVGGSPLAIQRSVLKSKDECSVTCILAHLFGGGTWDKRLPRDAGGRIVLDESPACIKHILHEFVKTCGRGELHVAQDNDFPTDEDNYLFYVSRVLRLPESVIGMAVDGGSTVLEGTNISRLTAIIRGWCPGQPNGLELLYRASRDGWRSSTFRSRCANHGPSTITLVRVRSQGNDISDSVVGGFSSVPWAAKSSDYQASPGAFLFMLKDGSVGSEFPPSRPVKWGIKGGQGHGAVISSQITGPAFGGGHDLAFRWGSHLVTLQTNQCTYCVDSAFVGLNGRLVAEIEMFRVYSAAATERPLPVEPACDTEAAVADPPQFPFPTASANEHRNDIDMFGKSIAGSLMEERIALREAQIELADAGLKVRASADALSAVYGPKIADGKEDPVVELNVRGSRVTTLLSTLQACPESFLATKFNQKRWPATDKDMDKDGRRLIDCSPSVFAKVLDVLRMRKRANWTGIAPEQGCDDLLHVRIKAEDRGAFEEFVEKHFPGELQSFIMDCVEPATVDGGR
ncbi:unnamed protein product [Pylaiella littoralis]